MKRLFVLAAALGLGACASLTEEQCLNGDWSGIGYQDGLRGYPQSRIGDHREACAKVGVSPDIQAWLAGRAEGLKRYCTPENAYVVGRNGNELNPVCPASQAQSLNAANAWGLEYHELELEIAELQAEISVIQDRLINEFTGVLTSEQEAERNALLREVRMLGRQIDRLELRQRRYAQLPL